MVSEKNEPDGLLREALEAVAYAEAVMSEDVLNAVTGDYAADHCIYEAIDKLREVLKKAGEEERQDA